MAAAYFLLLYLVFCHCLSIGLAKNESINIECEGKLKNVTTLNLCNYLTFENLSESPSVLARLTHLEIESKQQKQTIKYLERKVEKHEDVIEKLETKLKHKPSKPENHEEIENSWSWPFSSYSSTSSYNKEKRPARLLPSYIFYGYFFLLFL